MVFGWLIAFLLLLTSVGGVAFVVRRNLLPAVARLSDDQQRGVLEAWLPLLLSLPALGMMLAGVRRGLPIGIVVAPVILVPALAGLASLPAFHRTSGASSDPGEGLKTRHAATWIATGFVLLLLAATDRLYIWQGQLLLTAALILFWFGLPLVNSRGVRLVDRNHAAGLASRPALIVGLLSVAGGVLGYSTLWALPDSPDPEVMSGSVGIAASACLAGYVVMATYLLAGVSRVLGNDAAMATTSCWSVLGTWVGLGIWSLATLVGRFEVSGGPSAESPPVQILDQLMYRQSLWFPLNGFGQASFGAMAMLLAAVVYLACCRQPRLWIVAVVLGWIILVACLVVALLGVPATLLL